MGGKDHERCKKRRRVYADSNATKKYLQISFVVRKLFILFIYFISFTLKNTKKKLHTITIRIRTEKRNPSEDTPVD